MGVDRKKVYEALVDGATRGLSGATLDEFIRQRCPTTSGRKIVEASILLLTDPLVTDIDILNVIYLLAARQRLDPMPSSRIDDKRATGHCW